MKRILFAAATVAAFASSALAADIPAQSPVMKAAMVPVPVMSWTGCYIGAGGGYGMWNQENTAYSDPVGVPLSATVTAGGRGYFGTAQIGCDYQVGQNWVIGAFGDGDFGSLKGNSGLSTLYGEEKLKWSWAAGGRIGYLVMPQLLGFFSGGYTQAHFDQVDLFTVAVPSITAGSYIPGVTYNGWFLGSGYEYGIGWLPGLFWKTEYRFADYSSNRNRVLFTGTNAATGVAIDSHKYVQTIRSELVWRFSFH